MQEERRTIQLTLGNVSLEKELGIYYIDMRPAIIHYTSNIYDGGFDDNGVPMVGMVQGKLDYFSINIAQYGFKLHADCFEKQNPQKFKILMNCMKVLDKMKTEENGYAVWWHNFYEVKYKIQPPWASAMAQGELISLYLRIYQMTNDEQYLTTAIKAYEFLKVDFSQKGVRRYDKNGDLWFEEYPSEPPSFVLNGFIYTVFGLYDLYRVTRREDVKNDIDACIKTLVNNLKNFDAGYWSYYDLQKKELVRYYYQRNVHVLQMEILFRLTGLDIFRYYKDKWEKQLTPLNFLLVRIMYRVKPRLDKLKRILNVSR